MKTKITKLLMLVLVLLLSFTVVGCKEDDVEKEIVANATYEIHTELQKEYLATDPKYISLYAGGKGELSKPTPITITWEHNSSNEYQFFLSEDEEFKEYRKFVVSSNKIELLNLKIYTVYYWYIEFLEDGNKVTTSVDNFMIDKTTPRNLSIEGVTNVRDLGGYKIGLNTYVRQGMIYRSARFNENETTDLLITESGIKEMVEVLKIKSELDIRRVDNNENGGITTSPLGSSVNYYSVPMKSGGNLLLLNKTVIKDAFAVLGNEANYPVVIHCSIGTDRTGMLCFLINALLGVKEEDLYRDYLFSNFGDIGGSRSFSIIETYLNAINNEEGDTLAKRTQNYLLGIGVSEDDIKTVIRLMTYKI